MNAHTRNTKDSSAYRFVWFVTLLLASFAFSSAATAQPVETDPNGTLDNPWGDGGSANGNGICIAGVGDCPENTGSTTTTGSSTTTDYYPPHAPSDNQRVQMTFDGDWVRYIRHFQQYGSKVLVPVDTYYDTATGRSYELRRWTNHVMAEGNDRMVVTMGPGEWVEVSNGVSMGPHPPSAADITQWNAEVNSYHNGIYQQQVYMEQLTNWFQQNVQPYQGHAVYGQWAIQQQQQVQGLLQNARNQIQSYQQAIQQRQGLINQGAPAE